MLANKIDSDLSKEEHKFIINNDGIFIIPRGNSHFNVLLILNFIILRNELKQFSKFIDFQQKYVIKFS